MNFDIRNLIESKHYSEDKANYFSNFNIVDVTYSKSKGSCIIKAENDYVLPYSLYNDLIDYFDNLGIANLKLYLKAKNQDLPIREINLYLDEYRKYNNCFINCVPVIEDNGFSLVYEDENECKNDSDNIHNQEPCSESQPFICQFVVNPSCEFGKSSIQKV